MAERYCVVVDGYSAGNLLPPEFAQRGYRSIHVSSTKEIWPILTLTYRPDDYAARFAFDGDLAALVAHVKPFAPVCVMAGTETGVELADELGTALGLSNSNGIERSRARRDKFWMIDTVGKAGLAVARQHHAHATQEVVDWARDQGLSRVVVKPLKSAGTDSVSICDDPDQIRRACDAILGKVNQLGIMNDGVLVQEFLQGTEYALDAVSRAGRAHFTAIWRYHKVTANGVPFVYDRDELVPCTDETGRALTGYVRQVLDALAIAHGPSHAEVMMTPRGPMLVEIGTRLNGITTPELHRRCVGYGQLDLTADSYVDAAAFDEKARRDYTLKEWAISISLISEQVGVVKSVPGDALVRGLQSFDEVRWRAKPGYQLKRTIDFYTHPGFLMLIHANRQVLLDDLARLRAWEKAGALYELE